jgi:hypothetical protein
MIARLGELTAVRHCRLLVLLTHEDLIPNRKKLRHLHREERPQVRQALATSGRLAPGPNQL